MSRFFIPTATLLASVQIVCASLEDSVRSRMFARRDTNFDWANLTSSTNLTWTTCYDGFQCAKFTVPMQYSDPSAGEAELALVMSPSNYSHGDAEYLGPILFNPGGPGHSGVDYILEQGAYFRAIIGPQYDLVGFDPRGVGFTSPPMAIFKSPPEALNWYSTFPINANESVSSFGRLYAQSEIFGKLVADRNSKVAQSVGTAAVATDMLSIARAFGQEKLNYWGISYGSVLGATFAAMFPNNVGRLIIDGVFNSNDYYAGDWSSALLNTEASLTAFYAACVEAGPSKCAIYENTTDLIRARVDKIINDVHVHPLPVYNDTNPAAITFGVTDYTLVVTQLLQLLYTPFQSGPAGAKALVALEQGDGSQLYRGSDESIIGALDTCNYNTSVLFPTNIIEQTDAIVCGDILVNKTRTIQEARKDYEKMLNLSAFGTTWYPLSQALCATWPVEAKDRFNGSFTTNTSSPILLISNTHDPVTPIESARNMSSGFAGSVLLQQNSTGHTSMSGFSTCTALAIHAYFANGTLPAPGTICQTDTKIFDSPTNSSGWSGVNFTLPTARADDQGLSLHVAAQALSRSDFLTRNSVIGRMMKQLFV